MNIESLRNPWFMLAMVLLAGGAFVAAVLGWPVPGWSSIVVGLAVLAFARHRQGAWIPRGRLRHRPGHRTKDGHGH